MIPRRYCLNIHFENVILVHMSRRSVILGRSGVSDEHRRRTDDSEDLLIVERRLGNHREPPEPPAPPIDETDVPLDDWEPKSIFICGRCDMIVGEDDRECEFCGAAFDGAERAREAEDDAQAEALMWPKEGDDRPSQFQTAEKVDVLSMVAAGRSEFGAEQMTGGTSSSFLNFSKMLRAIEGVISDASEFGVETEEAKRALLAAWKACHEGKWSRAMQLANESKRALAPGVTSLVQGQMSCLREAIIEMKKRGSPVTPLVIEIKRIQKELSEMRLDEAIRSTKTLMAEIKNIQMRLLDSVNCETPFENSRMTYRGQGI
jgi:hypothetical protein